MNRALAEKVADAVLYEGYMLYPYRRSAIKNRQRWSFGILYPPAYDEVRAGTERAHMHSECIVVTRDKASLHVQLRFLQLTTCHAAGSDDNWEEGAARSLDCDIAFPPTQPFRETFRFPAARLSKLANDTVERTQHELIGVISVSSEQVGPDVSKVTIGVSNETHCAPTTTREHSLLSSMLSAHVILSIERGEFISLLDPPAQFSSAVKACENVGNFPVLVGSEGERDMMLCSPILLYDYPQVASESAGDFFDATEMDEMLTLRVMTLTDDEKNEVRAGDEHARTLLERTEQSAREQLQRTHGTIRSFRAVGDGRHE